MHRHNCAFPSFCCNYPSQAAIENTRSDKKYFLRKTERKHELESATFCLKKGEGNLIIQFVFSKQTAVFYGRKAAAITNI